MAKEIGAMNYPLRIVQGARLLNQYTRAIRDEAGTVTPVDISTATITGGVKAKYEDVANLTDFTITVIDAPNGIFRIGIPAATTETLPSGALKYEIRADWGSGFIETFFRGNLDVLPGIQS